MALHPAYAAKTPPAVARILEKGMQGEDVKLVQTFLSKQGFFKDKITGNYGPVTEVAVSRFQKSRGLPVDGRIGPKTAALLMAKSKTIKPEVKMEKPNAAKLNPVKSQASMGVSRGGARSVSSQNTLHVVQEGDSLWQLSVKYKTTVDELKQLNNLTSDALSLDQKLLIPAADLATTLGAAQPLSKATEPASAQAASAEADPENAKQVYGEYADWWTDAQYAFPIGSTATVTDFNTGRKFQIVRSYGVNHADCEPLSAEDTGVMKKLYPSWSWDTRAVIVEVNGRKLAASMSGMPHSIETIGRDNEFDGHFDIHFLNSRSHNTNSVRPEHQAMVKKAANRTDE